MEFLKNFQIKNEWPEWLSVVSMTKCKSPIHFKEFFSSVINKQGEGVMLRAPGSPYETGRSTSMRRYKEFQDTEVKIIKNMFPHGLECQQ